MDEVGGLPATIVRLPTQASPPATSLPTVYSLSHALRKVKLKENARWDRKRLAVEPPPAVAGRRARLHARPEINKGSSARGRERFRQYLERKYIRMGRDLTPEYQEAIVRGRLLENVIIGTDKGVMSAKQLGADKRISMWQPDSQVGMVVLQAPPIPKIDHEVEILPPIHADSEEPNG